MKVVKWCRKKWNKPNLMCIYLPQTKWNHAQSHPDTASYEHQRSAPGMLSIANPFQESIYWHIRPALVTSATIRAMCYASWHHQQLHSSSGHQIGNFTLHFQPRCSPFYGLLCPASRSAIDVLWMFLAKHIVARIPHFPGCWNIRSFVNAFSLSTAFRKKRGKCWRKIFSLFMLRWQQVSRVPLFLAGGCSPAKVPNDIQKRIHGARAAYLGRREILYKLFKYAFTSWT